MKMSPKNQKQAEQQVEWEIDDYFRNHQLSQEEE
jgi:hypothetical protein